MKKQIVFIEGKKIYLRPVLESDDKKEYLRWLNNYKINRYSNRMSWPTTEGDLTRYLNDCGGKKNLLLAIVEKKGERHIGNILLSSINWIARSGELSIMIGKEDAQGKGYGQEAWQLLARHAFEVLNLRRLEAGTAHPAMESILKKQGWTHEGTLRQAMFLSGKYWDVKRFGILREDLARLPRKKNARRAARPRAR